MIKSWKKRLDVIIDSFKLALSNLNSELTDSVLIAQWGGKKNKSFCKTRSMNSMLALLLAQVILLKRGGHLRSNYSNKDFVDFIRDCLYHIIRKDRNRADYYQKYHVRKKSKRIIKRR